MNTIYEGVYMKKSILLLVIFSFTAFLTSCESEITNVEDTRMMANIDVFLLDLYSDSSGVHQIPSLSFFGTLITNPISELKYILFDNDTLEVAKQTDPNSRGIISFRSPLFSRILNVKAKTFKLVTDLGYLEGPLSFPDTVSEVQINFVDTLRLSDTLKILFDGNADYYTADVSMSWGDEYRKSVRLVSKEKQFFIDSSFFEDEGKLYLDYITAYRGFYPEIGSAGNMYGDGKGFIYCLRPKSVSKPFFIVK